MSDQFNTRALVLRRVNYQESDRILTILTEENGKVSAIAKGVRKAKSKIASGIEPLALQQLTILKSPNREMGIVRSARNLKDFPNLIRNYDRSQIAFYFLKRIEKLIEDGEGAELFAPLLSCFEILNNVAENSNLPQMWLQMQILASQGSSPNLEYDANDVVLAADLLYKFSVQDGVFIPTEANSGYEFRADDIKAWRLLRSQPLANLKNISNLTASLDRTRSVLFEFFEFQTS
ncbi:DNA repair protein RecO [Candidatus Saccharibacteria bacterium]|jgi:DNA repair protein RecO|nr:DNA repair protein RecO [Candidatus Saccharibacteria bacterium]